MTGSTFALAGMRIIGVVSGFWFFQFLVVWIRAEHLIGSVAAVHLVASFPIIESIVAMLIILGGITLGFFAKPLSLRFDGVTVRCNRLPLLIGLAASIYMVGFACRTMIQLGAIEHIAAVVQGYGGRPRAKLGYMHPTSLGGRLIAPTVALSCVALMGLGLAPARRTARS